MTRTDGDDGSDRDDGDEGDPPRVEDGDDPADDGGYRSYGYLPDGAYRRFDLAEPHAGFEPYEVPLSADQEERVADLLGDATTVSLHDHPFSFPADIDETWAYVREGRVHTPYDALADAPLDAVFDFHLDGLSGIHSKAGWTWDDVVHDVAMRAADVAHAPGATRVGSVAGIRRARAAGRVAVVPALESAAMIENELDRIDLLYGLGVRLLGLTYNRSNSVGTGKRDLHERDGGLTAFGAEAIGRMNDVGMAVSTSHASRLTTLDTCEASSTPVFDTHAIAEGVAGPGGGTPDDCFEAIADTGGVIGVVASSVLPDIETYGEHVRYLIDLVGVDHVAFGPDVLYGDHRALLGLLAERESIDPPGEIGGRRHVRGLENPTEAWRNLPRWLVREGYDATDARKLLGGNVLRALEAVW